MRTVGGVVAQQRQDAVVVLLLLIIREIMMKWNALLIGEQQEREIVGDKKEKEHQ